MSTTRTLITTIGLTILLSASAIEAQPSVVAGGSSDVTTSTTETLSLDETRETPTAPSAPRYRVEFSTATVIYSSADQLVEAMSALRIYRELRLSLPHVTIEYFDRSECPSTKSAGWLAERNGELWITNCATRRTLLHELAHVWDRHNLTDGQRSELQRLRGLTSWKHEVWEKAAGEHLAETISWALDDVNLLPSRIDQNSHEELGAMYLLATGSTDAPIFERIPGLSERSHKVLDELMSNDDGQESDSEQQLLDHGNDLGAGDTIG